MERFDLMDNIWQSGEYKKSENTIWHSAPHQSFHISNQSVSYSSCFWFPIHILHSRFSLMIISELFRRELQICGNCFKISFLNGLALFLKLEKLGPNILVLVAVGWNGNAILWKKNFHLLFFLSSKAIAVECRRQKWSKDHIQDFWLFIPAYLHGLMCMKGSSYLSLTAVHFSDRLRLPVHSTSWIANYKRYLQVMLNTFIAVTAADYVSCHRLPNQWQSVKQWYLTYKHW